MFRHDRLALEDMGDGVIEGLVFRFKPADLPDGLHSRGEFLQRLQFIRLQLCQLLLAHLGGRDALDLFRPALMHCQRNGIVRQFVSQLLFQFPDYRVTLLGAFGKSLQHRLADALDLKTVFRRYNPIADLLHPFGQFVAINCRAIANRVIHAARLQCLPALFRFVKGGVEHREMRVQQRVERPAARVRERGGDQIAGGAVALASLFANPRCGKGFEFAKRNARRFLMCNTNRSSSIVTASTETDFGAEQVKS